MSETTILKKHEQPHDDGERSHIPENRSELASTKVEEARTAVQLATYAGKGIDEIGDYLEQESRKANSGEQVDVLGHAARAEANADKPEHIDGSPSFTIETRSLPLEIVNEAMVLETGRLLGVLRQYELDTKWPLKDE